MVSLTPTSVPATETAAPLLPETPVQPVTLKIYTSYPPGRVDDYYLGQLIDQFKQQHSYVAKVELSHSLNAAEIAIRTGLPPDAYAVNIGRGFFTDWVAAGAMEPLDDVYAYAGLRQAFPQGLIDLATFDDHPWAVPVSVARSNVLWYSRSILNRNDIKPDDLQTFSGWEAAAKKLQAAGITPLAFGNAQPWASWQLFEVALVGALGPEKYAGLWDGTTDWRGPDVGQALQNFRAMLEYTNPNHARIQWDQGYQLLIQHQAAMYIMGDWMLREFSNSAFGDYGWTTAPDTAGSFILWPDGFSLPHGTQHPEVAREFLAFLGSRDAQQYFNRNRGTGAVCARTDCNYSGFAAYNRASAADLSRDSLVPSIARAMADSEPWTADFETALTDFLQSGNLAAAQSDLDSACRASKICH
jgi:glucose/mannose transport system substrate-binding protein